MPVRFSVVIPTYQRRQTVLRTVTAFERQKYRDFEVVVVDDGSTDGTAGALRGLATSFPLTVVEQANRGAAQARNTGVEASHGEILLFLDDDMEAHPSLLAEHDRFQRGDADLVLGDLPLHPHSPANALSRGVATWAQRRSDRLTMSEDVPLGDLLTGQVSISRMAFDALGGFDVSFTRNGQYGGEDIDFGLRVVRDGYRVLFNPAAISYQYYDVDPAEYLRRGFESGRSDQELMFKHPVRTADLQRGRHLHTGLARWLLGPFVLAPGLLGAPLRWVVARLVRSGRGGPRLRRAYLNVHTMEYLRGVRAARRAHGTGGAVVLAYHAVEDLSDEPRLAQYGVPANRLTEQLDFLRRRGATFVDLTAVLEALRGERRLPRRALLLSFDDAYVSVLTAAAPILSARRIPAVVFAISDRIGRTNEWDRALRLRERPLLDADGLRAVAEHGVEVGSHAATHRRLTEIPTGELSVELAGRRPPSPRSAYRGRGHWPTPMAPGVERLRWPPGTPPTTQPSPSSLGLSDVRLTTRVASGRGSGQRHAALAPDENRDGGVADTPADGGAADATNPVVIGATPRMAPTSSARRLPRLAGHPAVGCLESRPDRVGSEPFRPAKGIRRERLAQPVIAADPLERARQRPHVARRDEQPLVAVARDLGNAAGCRRHHRRAGRDRLGHDDPERLDPDRRRYQRQAARSWLPDRRVRPIAQQRDPKGQEVGVSRQTLPISTSGGGAVSRR